MTTNMTIPVRSESFVPTVNSKKAIDNSYGDVVQTTSSKGASNVYVFHMESKAHVPVGFRDIDDVVADVEASPERAERMNAARQRIRARMKISVDTLKGLRLQAGLSQVQLAKLIGTSQPHVARIESGSDSIVIDTCRKLAKALNVDLNALDSALQRSQQEHKDGGAR